MADEKQFEILTIPQASRRTGLSTRFLREAIRRGDLPAVVLTPGGWPRVRTRDLEAWLSGNSTLCQSDRIKLI